MDVVVDAFDRERVRAELAADKADEEAVEIPTDRRARVEQTRLHARAVRQLMRYLRPERQQDWPQPDRMSTDREKGTP